MLLPAVVVTTSSIRAQAIPTCLGMRATIVGTSGVDTIYGTIGSDVIVGLGNQDLLFGGGGVDRICGGDGGDLLQGDGGNDLIDGGIDSDMIYGGHGRTHSTVAKAPITCTAKAKTTGSTPVLDWRARRTAAATS